MSIDARTIGQAQYFAVALTDLLPVVERRVVNELVQMWINRQAEPLDSNAAWAKIGTIAELRSMQKTYQEAGHARHAAE